MVWYGMECYTGLAYAEGQVLEQPLVLGELLAEVVHRDARPPRLHRVMEQRRGQLRHLEIKD